MWQRRTLARRRSRAALLAAPRSTLRALALCCALPRSGRTPIPPARAGPGRGGRARRYATAESGSAAARRRSDPGRPRGSMSAPVVEGRLRFRRATPPSRAMLTPPPPAAIIARRDAHPPDLADALPARRIPPQDDALLDERHHAPLPEGAHAAAKPGHLHRRADGRPRPRARRARGGRGRPHRHGAADPPRLRPGRPLPRARQAGRARGDVGVARPRGVAPPRRRRGRRGGGVRLAGRARRPRGRALARHLPRRALARPRGPPRHRLVEPAVAQGRRLPHELALPPVFLLAGLLLARLPAPVRVLL